MRLFCKTAIFTGYRMNNTLLTHFRNNPHILMVEKDRDLKFIDCNDAWLHAANFKNIEQAFGLTDRDCAWADFCHITESYENDILAGQAYPLLNPAFVENGRFCWIQNYKWPRYDEQENIIGIQVVAFEINNPIKIDALSSFKQKNKFGAEQFSINKPIKDNLTKREKETLFYLCYGLTTKKIAAIMQLSYRTIETYIENIKSKLGCDNKHQIIEYAVSKGYVSILPHNSLAGDLMKKLCDHL